MFHYRNNNHNKQQQNDCCCCFRIHNNKHCPIVKNCDDYNNSINQQITLKMSNQLAQIISNNSDDYYDNNNNNAPKSPCYSIMNNYIHIPPIKLNFINYLKVASHHHHHQSFLNDDNNNNPNRFTNNETHKHSTAISVLFPILSLIFINPILSLLNLKKLIKMKLLTLTKPFFAEEKRINHRTPQFKQQQPPMQQRSSVIFYSNKRNKNKQYLPSIHSNIANQNNNNNCISTLKIIILMMIIIIVASMPATTITSSLFVSAQPYDPGTNTITRVINPGDKVDIPCSVVTPGGSVRWALNNKPIPLDSNQRRHWNISNDGKATLTINRVSKMDAGLWECWKLDSDFNIRQKVPIMRIVLNNVPEEPYLEYEGRLLLSPNNIISVKANNVIKINCIIKGMASMIKSIQWFVGQQNFTHQSRVLMEYSAEEDVSLTISVLTLNVSAKFHHEPLTCQIAHMSWSNNINVTARFNVLYPPEFSIVREPGFGFPIIEGMDLILRCEIDANPMSPVRWERDSDPKISNDTLAPVDTSPDGTLIINGITTKDIGWYRCTTENELGFFASVGFFINVREATDEMNALVDQLRSQNPHLPSIPETSDDFHHRSSSDFAFRKIHDHSNRESHFQASRSNSPDFNNNNGYNNHQPQISRSDCSPTSGGSINNADGRPIIESINSTVIALVGSQITLIARFCCIPRPKKVYWIHRHLAMMPSRIIGRYTTRELIMSTNSMNCFTSNFIIDAVKPEDAGDVMFMVLNQKGIDNALVSLNVTMASYSISSSPSNGISSTSSAKSVTNSSSFTSIIITIIIMLNVILNYCNYFNHCIGLLQ